MLFEVYHDKVLVGELGQETNGKLEICKLETSLGWKDMDLPKYKYDKV